MNTLYDFLPTHLIKAIGWTLLHSLWQGMIVALVLALLLVCMHRSSAAIRYFVATGALFTLALIAGVTFINELSTASIAIQTYPATPVKSLQETQTMLPQTTVAEQGETSLPGVWSLSSLYTLLFTYFQIHLPLIVLLWGMGITLLIIRFIGGFAYTQRLKSYKTVELNGSWQQTLYALATAAGINKHVKLVESALVKTPIVVGYLKPVILLPVGTIIGLPAEQVEAVLAHELAHILRKDYLINIVQCLLEIVFFYHPAIWWISSRVRDEREHCCDDIALSLCGNRLTYAKALANLQAANSSTPILAFGFMGTGNGNRLLNRIKRLVQGPKQKPDFMEGFLAACFVMLSVTAISVSAGVQVKPEKEAIGNLRAKPEITVPSTTDAGIETASDTTKNTFTFNGTRNGKKYIIKAIMQRGTIVTLYVNGKQIADADKSQYFDLIYGLMESVPAPPSPAAAPTIAGRIDPGFPVEPVIAPHADIAEMVVQAPEDIMAVHSPPDVPLTIAIEPVPAQAPMPVIAPMPPDIVSDIVRAAFNKDTSFMKRGDFVYHFTGKKNKTYKVTIKDGILTELKVDGKRISPSDYASYAYIAEEMEEEAQKSGREVGAKQRAIIEKQRERNELQQEIQSKQQTLERDLQSQGNAMEESAGTHEAEMEKARQKHEIAMQEHTRAMAIHDESAKLSKELISLMNDELLRDKLIKKGKKHYIQISPEGLFIDKVKQPDAVFEKYKKLIEARAGRPMEFTIQYPFN